MNVLRQHGAQRVRKRHFFVVVDVLDDLDGNGDEKAADKYKQEILGGLEPFGQDKQVLRVVQIGLPFHPADDGAEKVNQRKAGSEIDDLKDEQLDKSRCYKGKQNNRVGHKGIYRFAKEWNNLFLNFWDHVLPRLNKSLGLNEL